MWMSFLSLNMVCFWYIIHTYTFHYLTSLWLLLPYWNKRGRLGKIKGPTRLLPRTRHNPQVLQGFFGFVFLYLKVFKKTLLSSCYSSHFPTASSFHSFIHSFTLPDRQVFALFCTEWYPSEDSIKVKELLLSFPVMSSWMLL